VANEENYLALASWFVGGKLGRAAATRDITLRELLSELEDRGISVSYYALSHILDDAGISFKEKPARQRTGPAGRRAPAQPVAAISGQDRSQPAGVHR
jgi:hypothetical protein